jgi:nitrile hydratase accessory protein
MAFEVPGGSNLLKLSETINATFYKPWHATAFALVIALLERDLVSRAEWAAALAKQLRGARQANLADSDETYHQSWLAALEGVVADKQLTTHAELQHFRNAWLAAADRTPHGKPIVLTHVDSASVGFDCLAKV